MANERRWLSIRDFVTLKPRVAENKKLFFETRDAKSQTSHSLLVHAAATHAGIVNGNRKFYRPDFMQDSVGTWLPQNGYPRPVLIGHNEDGEVLGRVREAKYVDDSWKWSGEFPSIKDSIFYSRDAVRRSALFKSVDWIVKNLQSLDDYTGLGHIDLGMNITNPTAIRKVLDDEYLTVSVGSATDEAICSVCHQDWASDDKCEHKPGSTYDGQKMFLICGRFKYQEVSFVNFPADPFAIVHTKELKDSLQQMFFLGLPIADQDKRVAEGLILTDGLYENDVHLSEEDMMQTPDVAAIRAALDGADLTAEQAFQFKDQVSAWVPESEEDKVTKRSLTSSLSLKIRKQGFTRDAAAEPVVTEVPDTQLSDAEVQAALAENEDAKKPMKKACDCGKDDCDCDDKQGNNAAKAAQQNVLSKGTGKGAVPEPSESTGKKDDKPQERPGGKKKKKCAACTKDFETSDDAVENCDECSLTDSVKHVIEFLAKDEQTKDQASPGSEVVALIKGLDAQYSKFVDGNRYTVRYAVRCLIDHWSADDELKYWLESLAKTKDSVVVSTSDMTLKDSLIADLTTEKDGFEARKRALESTAAAAIVDSKKSLASQVVMYRVFKNADGYQNLTAEQIQAKVDELAKRTLVSLRDTVHDLLSELEWVTPSPAANHNAQAIEPSVVVNDNAQVDESESVAEPTADTRGLKVQDARALARALSYITNPAERTRLLADIKFGRVTF